MKKTLLILSLSVLMTACAGMDQQYQPVNATGYGIVAPPPLQFAAPPDLYVVPSGTSYVYMVPNYDGVYFYGGNWYRFYDGYWFLSSNYNGYWDYIEPSMVPQVIFVVPPEYIHYVPYGYYRIQYNDFYSNWRTWDHKRHWDHYDWYNHERRDDIRRERYSRIERDRQQRGAQKPRQHDGQRPTAPRPEPTHPHRVPSEPRPVPTHPPGVQPTPKPAPTQPPWVQPPHGPTHPPMVQPTTPKPAPIQPPSVKPAPRSVPTQPPSIQTAPKPAPTQREHPQHDVQKKQHQQGEKEDQK